MYILLYRVVINRPRPGAVVTMTVTMGSDDIVNTLVILLLFYINIAPSHISTTTVIIIIILIIPIVQPIRSVDSYEYYDMCCRLKMCKPI